MLRAVGTILILATVACSSGGGGDAPDGAPEPDAGPSPDGPSPGSGGLSLAFVTQPALPTISPSIQVDELRFVLRSVRVLGDAAPGDSRTSLAELALEWRSDRAPAPVVFALAPPGVYASFEAGFEPGDGSSRLEVRGTVDVPGLGTHRFRIENADLSGQISVDLEGLTLDRLPRTATISLSLAFLNDIDWTAVEGDDELRIEAGDPQMPAVSSGLLAAFSLGGVS